MTEDDIKATIERRTEQRGECIVWLGSTTGGEYEYGVKHNTTPLAGGSRLVHRQTYALAHGVNDFAHIDHVCGNTLCCNPDHLEAVGQAENNRRSAEVRTDVCSRGHVISEDYDIKPDGHRRCARCRRQRDREHARRKRTRLREQGLNPRGEPYTRGPYRKD